MIDFFKKIKKSLEEKEEEEKTETRKLEEEKKEGILTVDLYQTENEFVLIAPLAGVESEDLEVIVDGNVLKIRGERKREDEDVEKEYLIKECYFGPFSRELVLSEEIDAEKIKATLKNGMLKITLPIIKKVRERRIKIEEQS